jgi:hypothetical protein
VIGTVCDPQLGLVVIVTDPLFFFTVTLTLTVPPPLGTDPDDGETWIWPLLLELAETVPVPTRF